MNRHHSSRPLALVAFLTAHLHTQPLMAQPAPRPPSDKMTPIDTPVQPNAIDLNTAPMPGQPAQKAWHSQYTSPFVRNVTAATLPPSLPDPAKATGTAVIIAPGGGFRTLSMENEGWVL